MNTPDIKLCVLCQVPIARHGTACGEENATKTFAEAMNLKPEPIGTAFFLANQPDPLAEPHTVVNQLISETKSLDKGKISDGYHTFDELYEHRCVLFMALCREWAERKFESFPVWRSRLHSDGTGYEGWFVLGMCYEAGNQITYHLPDRMWDRCGFATELVTAPEWDGHTSDDVLKRLLNL